MKGDATGIWKYWHSIVGVLVVLFALSLIVDAVLWYKVRTRETAAQTLNDIIASKQAPKTAEDKV